MKKTLGKKINELRRMKGFTLRKLGDIMKDGITKIPVSSAYLSDVENGRRFPSELMLRKLAAALVTTPEELQEHDQRGASRLLEDLVAMNPQYAFAMERVLRAIMDTSMSPEELIERVLKN